jgi:cysteine-rich repeat protein
LSVALASCATGGSDTPAATGDDDASASNDSGTGGDANLGPFSIGGTVTGLPSGGAGVVLANNGGDTLTVTANGAFTFATKLTAGQSYDVTVTTQPSDTQTCVVMGGTGTVVAGNVTSIHVNCSTTAYTIGGTISGLTGTVVLRNNGSDMLSVTSNGTFAFAMPLASGAAYDVTVLTQPSNPTQSCTVGAGTGTVAMANVTTVVVHCTSSFTIGGTVSGLAGSGLVLQDNGADNLPVNADGTFTFATPLQTGDMYDVTVVVQPSMPSQVCTVLPASATGTVGTSNVTGVTITCDTSTFTVGGTVTGLVGTGLVLQDNGGDNLPITANGSFTFATPVTSGQPYAVTTFQSPTNPWQTCVATNGSGTMGGANVTNVVVTCTTNVYTIGGTVSGLAATGLILQDNGGDNLSVPMNGAFVFATPIASGATYDVTVLTEPATNAHCEVTAGASGTVTNANITGVTVTCSVCGDGMIGIDETCDDGNTIDNDACTNSCTLGPIVLGGTSETYIASALTSLGETFTSEPSGTWPPASGVGTVIIANDGYTGTLIDYTAHLASGAHVIVVGGSASTAYVTWINDYVTTDPSVTTWRESSCTNQWTTVSSPSPTSTITQFLPATYNFTAATISYHMTEFLPTASQPSGTYVLGNTCVGADPNVLATRRYTSQGTFTYDAFDIGNYTDANSQAGYVAPLLRGALLYLRSPH